jgi:hypothetical protein
MDPQVIDAVWELYRDVGATQPIEIICGYRAPETNSMLRRRSGGVARFSQHTLGKAIDLHIPGVSLDKQREAALRLHRGGVGYYPSSTFIHVDVGSIRHWPRMSYDQLARVFPTGRTVHTPSNGRPLPGYQLALADVAKRGRSPSQTSLDTARAAGVDVQSANQRPSLLASLFGGARDAEEDEDETRAPKDAPKTTAARAATKVAAANAKREQKAETRGPAASAKEEADKPIRTASADGSVPTSPRNPPAQASAPDDRTAGATPWPLREQTRADRVPIDLALAYAAEPAQRAGPSIARAAAIGSQIDRSRPATESAERNPDNGPVTVVKKTDARLTDDAAEPSVPTTAIRTAVPVKAGMQFDDPWLRAAMFAPSLHTSLTSTYSGEPDYTELRPLMHKPAGTIVMTFSEDPLHGLNCENFTGGAVVFLATVTFKRTAGLRVR